MGAVRFDAPARRRKAGAVFAQQGFIDDEAYRCPFACGMVLA